MYNILFIFIKQILIAGRAPSIWDTFVRKPGVITYNSSADDAAKSYEFYLKDVDMLKKLRASSIQLIRITLIFNSQFTLGWTLSFLDFVVSDLAGW